VSVGAGATGLRGMVPATFNGKSLQAMTRDGSALSYTREVIKGVDYAFFPATAGAYTAQYETDTTAPAVSALSATPAFDGSATVTWTTNEPADSRVDYGTTTSLGQSATDAALVTAHSVRLTGLTPGTTYNYRVRSADGSANATTAPAAANPPATFRTAVTASPNAAVLETGTLRGGNAAGLTADDNVYYEVNSTTSGTRTTSWYGSFTSVPTAITGLRATYTGKNSRNCTQVIAAWRWTDSTWQQLNSSTVGTTEATRADLAPPGVATAYVSPAGEVRVRVRCTTTANFFASGDQLRITYTQ
jgi:purple acid phosphatase-like protein